MRQAYEKLVIDISSYKDEAKLLKQQRFSVEGEKKNLEEWIMNLCDEKEQLKNKVSS